MALMLSLDAILCLYMLTIRHLIIEMLTKRAIAAGSPVKIPWYEPDS